jgi:hypothetical protein
MLETLPSFFSLNDDFLIQNILIEIQLAMNMGRLKEAIEKMATIQYLIESSQHSLH